MTFITSRTFMQDRSYEGTCGRDVEEISRYRATEACHFMAAVQCFGDPTMAGEP